MLMPSADPVCLEWATAQAEKNSTNSSKPPSFNIAQTPKLPSKKVKERPRVGQLHNKCEHTIRRKDPGVALAPRIYLCIACTGLGYL